MHQILPPWVFATPLCTPRLRLAQLRIQHAAELLAYYLRNAEHLRPWEPQRSPSFWQQPVFDRTVQAWVAACEAGSAARFVLQLADDSSNVIGTVNFNNIIGPPFQACTLGYSIDEAHAGKGLMREALATGIAYMKEQRQMHRIMANHLPHNHRSAATLASLGFEREGYAKDYLQIDGRWQDHILTALTLQDVPPRPI
jgi:[ribosomal protein S5]-alanine N-acetyltransferase